MDQPSPPPQRSERGAALIAVAILGSALIVSWGMSNSTPRYQLAAAGNTIVRMDNDSGALIACSDRHCTEVQPPDRARTWGPLELRIGKARQQPALPAPETDQAR